MSRFRLLDLRYDTTLAIGLIMGAAVVFQQPLRFVLNAVGAIEQQYHLDLLPALVVLTVAFTFHQYRKRQESRAAALASEIAARLERERAAELDELVVLGRTLANSLDYKQIEQVVWRHLPEFLRASHLSLVALLGNGRWQVVVDGIDQSIVPPVPIDETAERAARRFEPHDDGVVKPVAEDGFLCFPVHANRAVIGAVLVRDDATMHDPRRQQSLAPILAFMGITLRNAQLIAESREMSVRDSLTHWFNRSHGLMALEMELRRGFRSGAPLALLMLDIDQFKAVNDTHGHLHGDAVLRGVASHVEGLLRLSDIKCRYGGDEFLIILPETPPAGAVHVAEHIRDAVAALELTIGADRVLVKCSVGVAIAAAGELDPEKLIARADAALYRAKRAGRNRVIMDGTQVGNLGASRPAHAVARA
jgi:diguanylate cyclase (GGDEF)-like protein